jgi:hypothetical protein
MFKFIPDLEELDVYPPDNQTLHTILEINRRRQAGPVKTVKGVITAMCEEYQQQQGEQSPADDANHKNGNGNAAGSGQITHRKSHQITNQVQQSFIATTSSYYQSLATGGAGVGIVGAQVFHAASQQAFGHTAAKLLQEDANVLSQQLGTIAVDAANTIEIDVESMVGAIAAAPEAGALNFSVTQRNPVGLGFTADAFSQASPNGNGKKVTGKSQKQLLMSFDPNATED